MDRHVARGAAALILASLLAAGCGGDPTGSAADTAAASPVAAPSRPPAPASSPPAADPSAAGPSASAGGPPRAALAADGGDPVVGDLGTYLWGDTGSDAPWLPGEPITVGSAEPLLVALDPAVPVVAWAAKVAPAGAEPGAATVLAEGRGTPSFTAPGPGAWTLALKVTFSGGLGEATYAWALTVPG